jgi:hypothetical protein
MRTARLSAWLLEAVAAGSAAAVACTPSPQPEPRTGALNDAADGAPAGGAATRVPASGLSGSAASTSAAPPVETSSSGQGAADPPNDPAGSDASAPEAGSTGVPRYAVPKELEQDCAGGLRNVVADLKAARRYDYVELRQRFDANRAQPLMARGKPCAGAKDADACHRELARAGEKGFGSSCHPAHCDFQVVVSGFDGVERFTSIDELTKLVGSVDTPGEALLMAFAHGHWVLGCDEQPPKRAGSGFSMTVKEMIAECPVVMADVSLSVASDGSVRVVKTANKKQTGACVGRRPPGLRASRGAPAPTPVAEYFAACAHLEAASVPAFERLSRELAHLGAPASLVRLCRRAAADERRHALVMRRLARARGAEPPPVELARVPLRGAAALALDNAVEGCVRETFGAAVGFYQARHASDPGVRGALAGIAKDEVRHAALAWKIAGWIEPRLSSRERQRVRAARGRALAALRRELASAPAAGLELGAGLPPSAGALRMFQELERTLWASDSSAHT